MRITRLTLLFGALLFPVAATAQAAGDQNPPAPTTQTAGDQNPSGPQAQTADGQGGTGATTTQTVAKPVGFTSTGTVDFGVLASHIYGDDARYNRFRDLSNGPFVDGFRMNAQARNWFIDASADHVARKDARYGAAFTLPGTLTGTFQWDQIRELVSNSTVSLFTQPTPGVLRVDDNVQNSLQTAAGNGTLATVMPGILENFSLPFTLGTERHIASGGISYIIDPDTTFKVDLMHTSRTGSILYSGTFGFSNAVDIPQPISQNTSEATLSIEHRVKDILLRAGFTGSYFRNNDSLLTWDNPYRISDISSLSSQGRTSVAPSNNWNVFNLSAQSKLPGHSVFTAYTAFGFLDDNGQEMIPMTINTAIAVPPIQQQFVGGKGMTSNLNLSLVSHPTHEFSFDARYKFYNYDNQTPIYSGVNADKKVEYDSSLQNGPWSTPRFGGSKQYATFDAHLALWQGTLSAGYTRNAATYDDRNFEGSGENDVHVMYDTSMNRFFSVHARYNHATRRGPKNQETFDEFVAGGEQPSLQHFDISDRDRDLFTMAASIFPVSNVSLNFSVGRGDDKYPNANFGLVSAKHVVYSAGLDYDPTDHLGFGVSFNQDNYDSLQWSRTANPAPDPTFTDPSKDWSDAGKDHTSNVIGSLRMFNLCHDKFDAVVSYDYTRGRGSYIYGTGPAPLDGNVPTTLPPPVQLPGLSNDFTRTTFDLTYRVKPKFSLGFSYWFENFKVSDLALGSTALPDLVLGTTDILMGYQYLPYTAHSFFGRATYRW